MGNEENHPVTSNTPPLDAEKLDNPSLNLITLVN
jgi:hypothetical protein